MKHLASILLLVAVAAYYVDAAPIVGKVTGEATIDVPDDPRVSALLARIEALEKTVKGHEAKWVKLGQIEVVPAAATSVRIEDLLK